MKTIFTLLIISLSCGLLYAQEDYNVVLPPSPTAASLGEYGSYPVSYYTGTPSISVPIFTLQGRELQLPISLSYMANGIGVEEKASWVGLGWSLNAGGVITRTVRGLDDFSAQSRVSFPLPSDFNQLKDLFVNIQEGFIDPEPDLYSFNFNGYSGTFVLDENGDANIIDYKDVKVELETTPSIKFTITTENGDNYIFTRAEQTGYYGATTSVETSAFYLTKIVSASGKEEINFAYTDENYQYYSYKRYKKYVRPNGSSYFTHSLSEPEIFGRNTFDGNRLVGITTNFGQHLEFVPESTARQDLYAIGSASPKALKEIRVYNDQGITYKYFVLETETIETTKPYTQKVGSDPAVGATTAYSNYRLYLKSVQEFDGNKTSSKPPYEFTYFGRDGNNKDMLPSTLSPAQDHWGFYNGANGNQNLWPGYDGPFGYYDLMFNAVYNYDPGSTIAVNCPETVELISKSGFTVPGANREPKFPEMRYGTLEKIQYPTGGSTLFDFGAQKYLYETEEGGYVTRRQLTGSQVFINYDEQVFERTDTVITTYFNTQFAFEMSVNCDPVDCNGTNALGGCWDPDDPNQSSCTSYMFDKYQENSVALINSNGDEVLAVKWEPGDGGFWIYKNGITDPDIGRLMPDDAGYIEMTFDNYALPPDTYVLKVIKDPGSDTDIMGWFHYYDDVPVSIGDETNALLAGGLRIDRIENYDENDELILAKEYEYEIGVLLSSPKYATYVFIPENSVSYIQQCTAYGHYPDEYPYLEIGCGPYTQLGYTKGGSVGYRSVTENLLGNGKITYDYTSGFEYPDNDFDNSSNSYSYFFYDYLTLQHKQADFEFNNPAWPFFQQDNLDRKRGFLLKTTFIDNSGKIIKTVENTPLFEDLNTVKGLRLLTLREDADWMYSSYNHSTGFVNISQTTETNISSNSFDEFKVTTENFFESTNHKFQTRKVIADSEGGVVEEKYKYPLDYSNPSNTISQMISKHIISPAIEQSSWVNGKLVSGKAIGFTYDITNDFVKPTTISIAETTGGITSDIFSNDGENFNPVFNERATYIYDDAGNVMEQISPAQVTSSFIWGYDDRFPVVKGENINHNQLVSIVSTALSQHSGSYTSLDDLLADIGQLKNQTEKDKWIAFISLLNSQVNVDHGLISIFAFDPLLGMISQADPNGIISYFEYDELGRMKLIKDEEGNIVQHQQYHYKEQ